MFSTAHFISSQTGYHISILIALSIASSTSHAGLPTAEFIAFLSWAVSDIRPEYGWQVNSQLILNDLFSWRYWKRSLNHPNGNDWFIPRSLKTAGCYWLDQFTELARFDWSRTVQSRLSTKEDPSDWKIKTALQAQKKVFASRYQNLVIENHDPIFSFLSSIARWTCPRPDRETRPV